MSTVIDSLPPDSRELFTDILGERDPGLLAARATGLISPRVRCRSASRSSARCRSQRCSTSACERVSAAQRVHCSSG